MTNIKWNMSKERLLNAKKETRPFVLKEMKTEFLRMNSEQSCNTKESKMMKDLTLGFAFTFPANIY